MAATDSRRQTGLDAVRGVAAVLVVVLHAALPNAAHRMPGLVWPVWHHQPSLLVDFIFWPIALVVMPIFLLLSGYGAGLSLQRRTLGEFLCQRRQRVLWPFIVTAIVILPFELYVCLLSWVAYEGLPVVKLRSLKLPDQYQGIKGLAHLWYLQYLVLYSVLLTGWEALARRWRSAPVTLCQNVPGHNAPRAIARYAACLIIVFSLWVTLAAWPQVLLGFQHGFLPHPAKFIICGLYFALGVVLSRLQFSQQRMASGVVALVLATSAMVAGWPLMMQYLRDVATSRPWELGGLLTAISAGTAYGVWRIALAYTAPLSSRMQFLADASFWIYLAHHPILIVAQALLHVTAWPAEVQLILSAILSLGGSLLSYRWWVEGRWLGNFLLGLSRRPTLAKVEPAASPAA